MFSRGDAGQNTEHVTHLPCCATNPLAVLMLTGHNNLWLTHVNDLWHNNICPNVQYMSVIVIQELVDGV